MKAPTARRAILVFLASAYLISVVITVFNCKPATFFELVGAILVSSYMSLYLYPFACYVLVLAGVFLAVPVLMAIRIYRFLTDGLNDEAATKQKRKKTGTSLSVPSKKTEVGTKAQGDQARNTTELSDWWRALPGGPKQLPAVSKPKESNLPAVAKPTKISKPPAVREVPKLPKPPNNKETP
ncbi:MAG: hypothetical protein K2X29_08500 [Candidatus Obscuribacterales bacterium]|nr:hypothetical protein [Candidatus Obscuribacterales bacterium]